ncbi:peptidylprolyl isomerase [Pricia sp. S334]|uniref:peptidylprolyl isomerase n=1 Tax=Pricia mediterranea TaxID=3076079 RepID=A0ABU3LB38_9FLAO|nr:peptidylprolyl isomerase [Pricia sp. S334]MDT7830438.1 peptidylprolyl isomerase [Pricia sp. S334]
MKTFGIYILIIALLIFSGCTDTGDEKYVIETELGDIMFEVYPEKAPITVGNFKKYVEQANFDGAYFYRVVRMDNQPVNPVKIEVIQGDFTGADHRFPIIEHETTEVTGLTHKDGTVSMGRFEVGTTQAEFFICINDQPELDYNGKRNPDGQGFAAFGQVLEGMDVVKEIQSGETDKQSLKKKIKISSISKLK